MKGDSSAQLKGYTRSDAQKLREMNPWILR